MRTRQTAGLLAGVLALSACGLQAREQPAGLHGKARIALVNVFSGPMGFSGEYVQNSLQVEVDALNARGGLLGQRLEVVAADDEQNPSKGAELVREQLTEGDVKLLVGPSNSEVAMAAKAAINAAQVPSCGLDLSDQVMSNAPYTFRIREQDPYRISALLGYLQRIRTEIKRIALLDDGSAAGPVYDRQLQEQTPRFGLQYLGDVPVAPGGDHRAAVQQLVQRGAQAVLLPSDPVTAGRSLLAVQQLGLGKQLQLLGTGELGAYSFALQMGDAIDGLIFEHTIQSYLTDLPASRWPPLYRSFVSRITTQYGFAANGVEMKGLPAAADCIVEWSRAVRAANSFNGPAVARAWERLDLAPAETVLGGRERLSPQSHDGLGLDGIFVYQWSRNGDRWTLKQLV